MTEVERLENALRVAKKAEEAQKVETEREVARRHVYPKEFPFHIDDRDEVTMGWFYNGPADENGDCIWDDYAEAKRRWENGN